MRALVPLHEAGVLQLHWYRVRRGLDVFKQPQLAVTLPGTNPLGDRLDPVLGEVEEEVAAQKCAADADAPMLRSVQRKRRRAAAVDADARMHPAGSTGVAQGSHGGAATPRPSDQQCVAGGASSALGKRALLGDGAGAGGGEPPEERRLRQRLGGCAAGGEAGLFSNDADDGAGEMDAPDTSHQQQPMFPGIKEEAAVEEPSRSLEAPYANSAANPICIDMSTDGT